jgi:hypothetical protein
MYWWLWEETLYGSLLSLVPLDGWPLLSSLEWWGHIWYEVYDSSAVLLLEGTCRI